MSEQGFVGFEKSLDGGAWQGVDTKRLEGADGTLSRALESLGALSMCKLRLRGAVGALVQALAGQSDAGALDGAWDRLQVRLDAELQVKETDDDGAVVASAERVRTALLSGQGTAQTGFTYSDEVAFGRTQVKLAGIKPLADDVARCGLTATLKRIDEATGALAKSIGQGDGAGRVKARSLQVRAAWNGCVAAFNGVHDDLEWLHAHTAPGDDRERLEALLMPLQRLLDDNKGRGEATAAKPDRRTRARPSDLH